MPRKDNEGKSENFNKRAEKTQQDTISFPRFHRTTAGRHYLDVAQCTIASKARKSRPLQIGSLANDGRSKTESELIIARLPSTPRLEVPVDHVCMQQACDAMWKLELSAGDKLATSLRETHRGTREGMDERQYAHAAMENRL